MTVFLASLLGCFESSPPPPRPNRFERNEEAAPNPTPGEPKAGDPKPDEPDGTDAVAEAEQPIEIGNAGKVPEVTQDQKNEWRKTGGRTLVSQPEFPPPLISPDQCDDIADGGPLMSGSDCVTAEIECEGRVIGHTQGGIDLYTSKFYEKKQCWPGTKDHDSGNERVYKLVMPEGEWRAWATLYTPCADLDLAAVRFDHDQCPTIGDNVGPCEMTVHDGRFAERIEMTTQTKRPGERPVWYIIVEGKDDSEGAFELDVQCRPGLGGPVDP